MKRFILVVTIGALLIGAALIGVARERTSSQKSPELAEIAVRPQELPEGWHSFRLNEGVALPDETDHPLNRFNKFEIGPTEFGDFVYNYIGYRRSIFIYDKQCIGAVGNYLYQYPSEEEARKVARFLIAELQLRDPAVYEIPEGKQVRGWAASFRGEEGGNIHWFVGTRGNVLILLVVDGPPGCFQEGFLQLVKSLLAR